MSIVDEKISGLKTLGIEPSEVFHNLNYDEIFNHEEKNNEGVVSDNGTMMVDTGIFTGRSPKDKYFVDEPSSTGNLWWGSVNKKVSEEIFDELYGKVTDFLSGKPVYVFEGFAGAEPKTTIPVQIVTQREWHQTLLHLGSRFAPARRIKLVSIREHLFISVNEHHIQIDV